jgi:hypothetical protein
MLRGHSSAGPQAAQGSYWVLQGWALQLMHAAVHPQVPWTAPLAAQVLPCMFVTWGLLAVLSGGTVVRWKVPQEWVGGAPQWQRLWEAVPVRLAVVQPWLLKEALVLLPQHLLMRVGGQQAWPTGSLLPAG